MSHKGSWSRVKDRKAWDNCPLWDKKKPIKPKPEKIKVPDYNQTIPPFTVKHTD